MLALLFISIYAVKDFYFLMQNPLMKGQGKACLDVDLHIILVIRTKLSTDTRHDKVPHFLPINFSPLHSDQSSCQRLLILST